MAQRFFQKATVQSALVHGAITFIAILIAGVAIFVDRNYYIASINQSQQNFEKNYYRDSIIHSTQMDLTQMQVGLLKRQMMYDSVSLEKQLAIAQTQLSVQLQENRNQSLVAKERMRRTLWEMSRLLPHEDYIEYKGWTNSKLDSLLGKVYELLVREFSNSVVLTNKKMNTIWHEFIKRIEVSRLYYTDTTQVRFIGGHGTESEQWADQRFRDGSFVSDRTWALMLALNNQEIPNEFLGFRDPEDYWFISPKYQHVIRNE